MDSDNTQGTQIDEDKDKQQDFARRYNAIINKWGDIPVHYKTIIKLLPVFILLAAIPLTVRQSQMQQTYQQEAATTNTVSLYVAPTGSDSNSCIQTAPCKTIAHTATLATAGTTVHVAPGTYSEGQIAVPQSGTADSPIIFASDSPLAAKIASSSWAAFYVTGNYITIKGFEIYMTNPGSASAIIETHGSNETITDNYVHDVDNVSGASCFGGAAIDIYHNDNIIVSNNKIAHAGPSTGCSQMHGVYIGGSNNIVKNNIAWDISGYCYQGWPTLANSSIMNNNGDNCRTGGIIIGWDGTTQPQANNDVIGNNIIRSVSGYGIRDCCSTSSPPGTNMQYLNNDVYGALSGNYFFYQPASVNSGGLSVDPQYVNWLTSGGGDYHLQASSQLIDSGTSNSAPSTDYDYNPRPQGKGFDIGAYEFGNSISAISTPTPTLAPTNTPTPTPIPTATPTLTPTPTLKPTATPTPVNSYTSPTPTITPMPNTPTPTPTLTNGQQKKCYKLIYWKFCF